MHRNFDCFLAVGRFPHHFDLQLLLQHFGLRNLEQLLRVIGDDFRYVEPAYIGPKLGRFPDGSVERAIAAMLKAGIRMAESAELTFRPA